ncbi:hypothetical protein DPMN_088024 [Dreissena polymorpha]|uniref:F5/8 type C domain-containing protein n=1 Tax=Dreissena polymorpha TaxID=45954 RepID=A0A9D4KVG5_DREPO|nr:hypothetical protein DPMN_088024 [Dreissena polymorpha]
MPFITSSTDRDGSSKVSSPIGRGATRTGSPPPAGGSSPMAVPSAYNCSDQWSIWYNRDNTNDGKEMEFMTEAEKRLFCPYGTLTAIECLTTNGTQSYSTGEFQLKSPPTCTMEGGSVCLNSDNDPITCSDYQIRYYCKCEGNCRVEKLCGLSHPSKFDQFIFKIRDITAVECQTVDGIASYSTGEVTQCTMEGGSVCLNGDNDPIPCSDYQIRYYCKCEARNDSSGVGNPLSVPNTQLSSSADVTHAGGWASKSRDFKSCIQVDLLASYDVTGVAILERADGREWTVAYTSLFSTDGVHFSPLLNTRDGGEVKLFNGNADPNTSVNSNFTARTARWIRIYPNASMGSIALGFDVLGCHGNTVISTAQVLTLIALIVMVALCKKYRENKVAAQNGTDVLL